MDGGRTLVSEISDSLHLRRFGKVVQYISFLVPHAALHRHGTKDLLDGRPECL